MHRDPDGRTTEHHALDQVASIVQGVDLIAE